MPNFKNPAQLDSSIVYQCLAGCCAIAGAVFLALRMGPPQAMYGGALLVGSCAAMAAAQIPDPEARRRAGGWLSLAFGCVLLAMFIAKLPDGVADTIAINLVLAFAFVSYYVWRGSVSVTDKPALIGTLFRRPDDVSAPLRSRYEESIRQAAAHEERHRLARDLHDSVKQQLFVIQTSAATAQARFDADPAGARAALAQVRDAARDSLVEMQAMLDQLRAEPLETTGLAAAIRAQCEALELRTGAKVTFEVGNLPQSDFVPPGSHAAIFRAAQESLANVARHARAAKVHVTLDASAGQLALTIRDDGAGFDTNHPTAGMGLANLRTRAAELDGIFELLSTPGAGTTVRFVLPYWEPRRERHGLRAAGWALFLFWWVVLVWWRGPTNQASGWILALAVLECARQFVAWRRMRKVNL